MYPSSTGPYYFVCVPVIELINVFAGNASVTFSLPLIPCSLSFFHPALLAFICQPLGYLSISRDILTFDYLVFMIGATWRCVNIFTRLYVSVQLVSANDRNVGMVYTIYFSLQVCYSYIFLFISNTMNRTFHAIMKSEIKKKKDRKAIPFYFYSDMNQIVFCLYLNRTNIHQWFWNMKNIYYTTSEKYCQTKWPTI